jgi:hypothetical protein
LKIGVTTPNFLHNNTTQLVGVTTPNFLHKKHTTTIENWGHHSQFSTQPTQHN